MVIYRPHRGLLVDSMKLAKEFNSFEEMKEYIVSDLSDVEIGKAFCVDDIVIDSKSPINDCRTGWKDTMYVCTKRCFNKKYDVPQCIGMCATKYNGCFVKCEDCKWFEPFNGVCFNAESEHCADMPWQYGITGCEKGELKNEQD